MAFRAQDVLRTLDDPPQMAVLLEIFGNTFGLMRQYDKALEYHRQCLALRLKINEPRDLAWTYSDIGVLLASNRDFEGALTELTKAQVIRSKLQSPADLATALNLKTAVEVSA